MVVVVASGGESGHSDNDDSLAISNRRLGK